MTKSLTHFGPEVLATLVEGSRREVSVSLTYAEAVRFRQRMHQLRSAMRAEKHPLLAVVEATRITIELPPDTPTFTSKKNVKYPRDSQCRVTLLIRPQDSDFRQALNKAGISIEKEAPPSQPLIDESPDQILEEFLRPKKVPGSQI